MSKDLIWKIVEKLKRWIFDYDYSERQKRRIEEFREFASKLLEVRYSRFSSLGICASVPLESFPRVIGIGWHEELEVWGLNQDEVKFVDCEDVTLVRPCNGVLIKPTPSDEDIRKFYAADPRCYVGVGAIPDLFSEGFFSEKFIREFNSTH